jgi:hypothetical protein
MSHAFKVFLLFYVTGVAVWLPFAGTKWFFERLDAVGRRRRALWVLATPLWPVGALFWLGWLICSLVRDAIEGDGPREPESKRSVSGWELVDNSPFYCTESVVCTGKEVVIAYQKETARATCVKHANAEVQQLLKRRRGRG